MNMERPKREPRVKQSIAFRRDQFAALLERAEQERHGNISLIVQRALDRELERCDADAKTVDQEAAVA
jgi:hypothetical protein